MLRALDVKEDGLIHYQQFIEIGSSPRFEVSHLSLLAIDVLLGIMICKKSEVNLLQSEEEFQYLAFLILNHDEMHIFVKEFEEQCSDADEYNDFKLKTNKVIKILESVSGGMLSLC